MYINIYFPSFSCLLKCKLIFSDYSTFLPKHHFPLNHSTNNCLAAFLFIFSFFFPRETNETQYRITILTTYWMGRKKNGREKREEKLCLPYHHAIRGKAPINHSTSIICASLTNESIIYH